MGTNCVYAALSVMNIANYLRARGPDPGLPGEARYV